VVAFAANREAGGAVVRQDERGPFRAALGRARAAAYPPGEYVGQESFMRADEILRLALQAGIGPGVEVLDLCCGVAGPGRFITAELGCRYLGVDGSASAVQIARGLAGDLPCRFEQRHLPPLPDSRVDVVLLLETILAFPDKRTLLAGVAGALLPGGRFACTVEEGRPLTPAEQGDMPDADTVRLVKLAELTALLDEVGLTVTWQEENTKEHQATAAALLGSYRAHAAEIAGQVGTRAVHELIAAHQLWSDWLGSGRVRKFALVAEKRRG
jgi:SAM-dependent methyltransferase